MLLPVNLYALWAARVCVREEFNRDERSRDMKWVQESKEQKSGRVVTRRNGASRLPRLLHPLERRLELALLVHLVQDVAAAHKLALDENLRGGEGATGRGREFTRSRRGEGTARQIRSFSASLRPTMHTIIDIDSTTHPSYQPTHPQPTP